MNLRGQVRAFASVMRGSGRLTQEQRNKAAPLSQCRCAQVKRPGYHFGFLLLESEEAPPPAAHAVLGLHQVSADLMEALLLLCGPGEENRSMAHLITSTLTYTGFIIASFLLFARTALLMFQPLPQQVTQQGLSSYLSGHFWHSGL